MSFRFLNLSKKRRANTTARHSPGGDIVAKNVRRDLFAAQRWTDAASRDGILCEYIFEARAGQPSSSGVKKEFRSRRFTTDVYPGLDRVRYFLPKREDPVLAALTSDMDIDVAGLKRNFVETKTDQFGNP